MGDIIDMIIRMNKRAAGEISNIKYEMNETEKSFKNFTDEIRNELLQIENNYKKPILPNASCKKSRSSKRLAETSSSDEDADVSSTRVKLHNLNAPENTSGKPKRSAAKTASANIKKVSNMRLNTKMRRPSQGETQSSIIEFNPNIIKIEKRSESMVLAESVKSTALSDVTNECMPPPTSKPKRGRKKVKKETEDSDTSETRSTERVTRSTRSRTKESAKTTRTTRNISVSPRRKDSDVLIQEVPITVVVVTDSESEADVSNSQLKNIQEHETEIVTDNQQHEDESRKTERNQKGREQTQNKMKLKIKEEEVKNNTQSSIQEVSVYEDALSGNKTLDEQTRHPVNQAPSVLNETHIINKNSSAITDKIKETGVHLNCTVVLESVRSTFTVPRNDQLNETKVLTDKPIPSNLLTDDESIEVSPPTKTPNKKQLGKSKPIFSPYGNSPVKKRVAAFEKLGTGDAAGTRVTRTKTRNLANAEKNQASPVQETPHSNRGNPPPTSSTKTKKHYTPLTNNKLPTMIPQLDSKNKNKNSSVVSSESVKCLTAVKASRAELQERREEEQKRKMEHENEVKRKKEAMLQAKIEEQKRKREEKQMKAQKAREAKEREKEEKIRRIIQEKEEKLQKEEQMKREWMNTMAKKAAEEEKRQQMLKQEKLEQKRKLNKKPPPLPTDDLQDTDEEDENPKHKYVGPLWSQRQNLYPTLYTQRFVPNAITKEFFQMHAQTPDLLEIFETVHADVLKRNSSAVWRTPPRYSTLPKF